MTFLDFLEMLVIFSLFFGSWGLMIIVLFLIGFGGDE